jgi:hypothetical protein
MWNLIDPPQQSVPEELEEKMSTTEEPNDILHREELGIFKDTTESDVFLIGCNR